MSAETDLQCASVYLAQILEQGDDLDQMVALQTLLELGPYAAPAEPALLAMLEGPSDFLVMSVLAEAGLRSQAVFHAMSRRLLLASQSGKWDAEAATALVLNGDVAAINPLITASAADPDGYWRDNWLLHSLSGRRPKPHQSLPVLTALYYAPEFQVVKGTVLRTIIDWHCDVVRITGLLDEALKSDDAYIRSVAAGALSDLATKEGSLDLLLTEYLLRSLNDLHEVAQAALPAFSVIRHSEAGSSISKLLVNAYERQAIYRPFVFMALRAIQMNGLDTPESIVAIGLCLRDADSHIAFAAATTAALFGSAAAGLLPLIMPLKHRPVPKGDYAPHNVVCEALSGNSLPFLSWCLYYLRTITRTDESRATIRPISLATSTLHNALFGDVVSLLRNALGLSNRSLTRRALRALRAIGPSASSAMEDALKAISVLYSREEIDEAIYTIGSIGRNTDKGLGYIMGVLKASTFNATAVQPELLASGVEPGPCLNRWVFRGFYLPSYEVARSALLSLSYFGERAQDSVSMIHQVLSFNPGLNQIRDCVNVLTVICPGYSQLEHLLAIARAVPEVECLVGLELHENLNRIRMQGLVCGNDAIDSCISHAVRKQIAEFYMHLLVSLTDDSFPPYIGHAFGLLKDERIIPLIADRFDHAHDLESRAACIYSVGMIGIASELALSLVRRGLESGELVLQALSLDAVVSLGRQARELLPLIEKCFEKGCFQSANYTFGDVIDRLIMSHD